MQRNSSIRDSHTTVCFDIPDVVRSAMPFCPPVGGVFQRRLLGGWMRTQTSCARCLQYRKHRAAAAEGVPVVLEEVQDLQQDSHSGVLGCRVYHVGRYVYCGQSPED